MKNGYAICFNEWALDQDIKNELGLLLIISSLTAEKGYCYASNNYIAEKMGTREETISRKLKKLQEKGYIDIEYKKKGCEVTSRIIRLTKMSIHDCEKCQSTIDENVKENITSINITNKKEIYKERKFEKPTLEEVEEYCKNRNSNVDAKTFYDYFEVGGWVDSKGNKVKNWKQKIITWERNRAPKEQKMPEWFDKEQESEKPSTQEQDEMEEILNDIQYDL